MPMMMATRARTEARTPKMMVPLESVLESVLAEAVGGFRDEWELRLVLVLLNVDMVAMIDSIGCWGFWKLSAASRKGDE